MECNNGGSAWADFARTGRVEDYLRYRAQRAVPRVTLRTNGK